MEDDRPDGESTEPRTTIDSTEPERTAGAGVAGVVNPAGIPRSPGRQSGSPKPTKAQRKAKQRAHNRAYRERKAAAGATAGSTAGPSRKSSTQAALDLNHILFSGHMMLAALTKQPSLVLTEEESEKLAKAINRVMELYETPLLDEKSRAWLSLSMVGVEVYGTRLATAVIERKKQPPRPQAVPSRPPYTPPAPPITPIDTYTEAAANAPN